MEIKDDFACDPRGYRVKCSKGHFKYLLSKHHESENLITEELIRNTIEKPALGIIYVSNSNPNRQIFYKKVRGWLAEIVVVVEFSEDNIGEIITFHLSSNRSPDEKIIWPDISR